MAAEAGRHRMPFLTFQAQICGLSANRDVRKNALLNKTADNKIKKGAASNAAIFRICIRL
jgi:hypothetical protein